MKKKERQCEALPPSLISEGNKLALRYEGAGYYKKAKRLQKRLLDNIKEAEGARGL